jgi:hypothetical protein
MRLALTLILISACGSSNPAADAPVVHDTKPIDAASVFMDGPPGTAPLKVLNFDAWCSIAVNGGATSTLATQLVNVMPGSITLVAKRASSTFEIGPTTWHDTAGDTGGSGEQGMLAGSGADETSSTTVTVGTAAKCVWACCPFAAGNGCPTDDQCLL